MIDQADFFGEPAKQWKSAKAPGEALVFNEPRFQMMASYYRDVEAEVKRLAGKSSQKPLIFALQVAFVELIAEPCVTRAAVIRKVEYLLSDSALMEYFVGSGYLVRLLLSSLACVRNDVAPPHAATDEARQVFSDCSVAYQNWRVGAEIDGEGEAGWMELQEAFRNILILPCPYPSFVARKAVFILRHEDLAPSSAGDIETMLQSFMFLKEGV